MKLKVKTNNGFFGTYSPEHEAVSHHNGHERINSFSESSINSRLSWDFSVKAYGNSGEIEGITVIRWEESVKPEVLAGLVVVSFFGSILGGGGAAVGYAMKKREYIAYFNSMVGTLVTEQQAENIQRLNRTTIAKKLAEIADLVNLDKDTCDLDEAASQIQQLLNDHKTHLSSNNNNIINQLIRQRDTNEAEMKSILIQHHQAHRELTIQNTEKILSSLNDGFKKVSKQQEEIFNKSIVQLEKITREILKSRNEADEKFKAAEEHRKNIHNSTEAEINKLRADADKRFDEAKKHRDEIYVSTKVSMEKTLQEILTNRELAKQQFDDNIKARKSDLEALNRQFDKIENQYKELSKNIREEFSRASQQRKEQYEKLLKDIEQTKKEVLESRKQANEQFEKARIDREKKFIEQKEALTQLNETMKKGFEEATKDRANIKANLEKEINLLKKLAEEKFKQAEKQRDEIYTNTQKKLDKMEQEVLKARELAEKRFEEASKERQEIYQETEDRLSKIGNDVLEARADADSRFEEATTHRETIYSQTEAEIGKTNEEIDNLRREADRRFEEAMVHREKIYENTITRIKEENEKVNTLRDKAEKNFSQATEKRKEIFDETSKQIEYVVSDVNKLRDQAKKNFETASQKQKEIFETTIDKLGTSNKTLKTEEGYINELKKLRLEAQNRLASIENNGEQNINKILSVSTGNEIRDEDYIQIQAEIASLTDKYKKTSNFYEQSKLISQAIDKAVSAAMIIGNKYDFKEDKFKVKSLLKNQLKLNLDEGTKKWLEKISDLSKDLLNVFEDIKKLKENLSNKDEVVKNEDQIKSLEDYIAVLEQKNKQYESDLLQAQKDKKELFELLADDQGNAEYDQSDLGFDYTARILQGEYFTSLDA
jgi:hypothetical protein